MEERSQTSVRYLQKELNISYNTSRRILQNGLHLYSYCLQPAHEILPISRPKDKGYISDSLICSMIMMGLWKSYVYS